MANTGTRDQRRHPRLATREAARFICAGATLRCEIRDFCLHGLYLSFSDTHCLDGLLPRLPGASAQVEFQTEAGQSRRFLIDAQVAHLSPGGIGLYVEHLPEGAAQALHTAAQVTIANIADLPQYLDPSRGKSLHQECSNLFRIFLDTVLQDFFSQAPTKLTTASYELSSFIERGQYAQGVQLLVQGRDRLQETFFNTIRQHVQRIGLPDSDAQKEGTDSGLALIDEEEFQDWLNLSGSINEVELAATVQLAELERGLNQLFGAPLPRWRNPYAPELLCRSFQDAIQFLDFSIGMRAILYRTFGHALSRHIGSLYEQMNAILAPLQPKPAPKRKPGADQPAMPSEQREPVEQPRTATTQPEQNPPDSIQAKLGEIPNMPDNRMPRNAPRAPLGGMTATDSAEYSLDSILARINQPTRISAGLANGHPANNVSGGGVGRACSTSAGRERPYPIKMAAWLRQSYPSKDDARNDSLEAVAGALPEAGSRQLISALNALSQAPLADGAVTPALSERVQAWLAATGDAPSKLAPASRQVLDMASSLIGRARAEHVASSEVELLLRRLERPLLKLAVEDEALLVSSDHPARQVVNLIDQYAIAANDKGQFFDPQLQRFLSLMVDRVCAKADEEPDIFATVRDNLTKTLVPILQARRARVARLQESCEARERIRQARARVSAALDARFAGREVPALLPRLLDAGWRQYLVLLEMRAGMGEAWQAGLEVLDRIAVGLADGHRTRREDQHEIRTLLNLIDNKLASVNVDTRQRSALMRELAEGLQRDAAPAPPTLRFPPAAQPIAATDAAVEVQERLKEQLRVGEWWAFSVDGIWVPMQLIWLSQPPTNCTFVNRSATDKLELGLAELARETQGGMARPGANLELPLLDRSEFALFDDTYHGLLHQLHQDPVTGLDNREGFLLKLGQVASASARRGRVVHTLCVLEFDQFRLINNQHGPKAGETLSRKLADALRKLIRPLDILSAFHEDTFALFLSDLGQVDAMKMAEGLARQLGDFRFQHGEDSYSIGLNLGLAEYVPTLVSIVEAIRRADSACLTAKTLGRNRIQAYEPSNIQLRSQESLMELAGRIDALMANGGLYLRAQMVMPINADTDLLPYYEILLGINTDDGQAVPPMLFIPAIESLKRSHEIDIWVVKQAFAWIRANLDTFAATGGFSINLSALSLSNSEVLAYLLSELARADLPTEKIIFEITETAAIESYNVARDFMRQISRYGCKFSLDDFGSGYSSYSHLKNLHTHSLKIDGSFVKEMIQNPADFAMVKSMNDIGHSLGMKTVAEYVESAEILSQLRVIGVDYAQGYVLHKPAPIDDLCPPGGGLTR
jgi:diguanylate cyclase (GGDEF)-like protein